jgi:hypothetical protein
MPLCASALATARVSWYAHTHKHGWPSLFATQPRARWSIIKSRALSLSRALALALSHSLSHLRRLHTYTHTHTQTSTHISYLHEGSPVCDPGNGTRDFAVTRAARGAEGRGRGKGRPPSVTLQDNHRAIAAEEHTHCAYISACSTDGLEKWEPWAPGSAARARLFARAQDLEHAALELGAHVLRQCVFE